MSRTSAEIGRHLKSATSLKSVVRTMKSLALVSLGPYERAAQTLAVYEASIEYGFRAVLWNAPDAVIEKVCRGVPGRVGVVVFGTDHGMAADFNERLARFTESECPNRGDGFFIWPVGELVASRLEGFGQALSAPYRVPESVESIPGLLSQLVQDIEKKRAHEGLSRVIVHFQTPIWGAGCEPASAPLLPLDPRQVETIRKLEWPSRRLPESFNDFDSTLAALLREHLFIRLFRACVRSGAAEHSVRLAAMQRAEHNIDELLESLGREYHEQRQAMISEELFDVIAGFEVLKSRP